MSNTPLLSVESLCTRYGPIEVLHDLSLEVRQGEIVSLLGANGAGKSTTLMCISGIQPTTQGKILFQGRDLQEVPAHERVALGLCQVPEGRRIFSRLTVHDNLRLGAFLQNDKSIVKQREEYIFSLFPILSQRANQTGGTLSGGEQQMLAIGRALMSNPKMLLLDEPSMGIAPLLVQKIFATLEELNREGLTILLIEQNAHLALKISKRAYILETGRVILAGEAAVLASDSRVQEAYLGG